MKLAVIIINWNNAGDTIACIRNVSSWQTVESSIWVVDNNSGDGSGAAIGQAYPEISLIRSKTNLGFSGANNVAIRRAIELGHDEILLLNNDAKISESNITGLLKAFREDPALAIAGPVLHESTPSNAYFSIGGRNIARHYDTRILTAHKPAMSAPCVDVDYVPGTVALLRAKAVDSVGLFDERYFFSGEMADLCMAVQREGYRTAIVTSVMAEHDTSRAGALRNTLYAYYNFRNRFLFVRKFDAYRWRLFWQFSCVLFVASNLVRGRFATARAISLALWDSTRGRFGNQNKRVLVGRSTI